MYSPARTVPTDAEALPFREISAEPGLRGGQRRPAGSCKTLWTLPG
jgi:hypothetical protein